MHVIMEFGLVQNMTMKDFCTCVRISVLTRIYRPKGTNNLMTTPIILNVVIISTKHLLRVYHCQQSILAQFNVH